QGFYGGLGCGVKKGFNGGHFIAGFNNSVGGGDRCKEIFRVPKTYRRQRGECDEIRTGGHAYGEIGLVVVLVTGLKADAHGVCRVYRDQSIKIEMMRPAPDRWRI